MFSRRHYVAIAKILAEHRPNSLTLPASVSHAELRGRRKQHVRMLDQLAYLFGQDNPAFKVDQFLRAAGEEA